jgi:DNA-binding transcriptional MocR family regulator
LNGSGELKKTNSKRRPRAISAEPLSIQLLEDDKRPLFVQIREHIVELVSRDVLKEGMRLPPIRELAQQLHVNQITVAKAYRDLSGSGVIDGRRGGGSFVSAKPERNLATQPPEINRPLLAERLFELAHAPGVIAFTSNYPLVDSATKQLLADCIREATETSLEDCFEYDPPHGRFQLREQIRRYFETQGLRAGLDNIVVTSGAQQAIDLSIRALAEPDSSVLVERPAYYGVLNSCRAAGVRIFEVPLRSDGMDLDVVRQYLIRHRPKLICTNPTFQNPSGISMSLEKRRALLDLCRKHGVIVLEDDHSPELRFSGKPVPSIRSLAGEDDLVIYARGFGKVFLPGMRVGCLVAPHRVIPKLLAAKAQADLHSNSFIQEITARYLARNDLARRVGRLCREYSARQGLVYDGLREGMPAGTEIVRPEGGLSLWLTLPNGADVSELYFRAVRRGVAFVSGDVFYASSSVVRSLRVSFGLNKEDELAEGVARLCSVVDDLLGRSAIRSAAMT